MKDYIENRVLEFAHVIIRDGYTVRDIAEMSTVSKSTVHKDLNERLRELDLRLWREVRSVLDTHLEERAVRGGNATKKKWKTEI